MFSYNYIWLLCSYLCALLVVAQLIRANGHICKALFSYAKRKFLGVISDV